MSHYMLDHDTPDSGPGDNEPARPDADDIFSTEEAVACLDMYAARASKRGEQLATFVLAYAAGVLKEERLLVLGHHSADMLDAYAHDAFMARRHGEEHDVKLIAQLLRGRAK